MCDPSISDRPVWSSSLGSRAKKNSSQFLLMKVQLELEFPTHKKSLSKISHDCHNISRSVSPHNHQFPNTVPQPLMLRVTGVSPDNRPQNSSKNER